MTDRMALCRRFIAGTAWSGATVVPMAPDASTRRYLRLTHPTMGPAVLMDADPSTGHSVAPFLTMTQRLRSQHLSAPEIHAQDSRLGLILMEDFGDDLFARHLEHAPADEELLYGQAIDLLAELQARSAGAQGLIEYDLAIFQREALQVLDWYAPATRRAPSEAARAEFLALIAELCGALEPPSVIVLLDYHAENLIWLPERNGAARCGLLDYQDARFGHPAYDLVSLLGDARRDNSMNLRAGMLARFSAATGHGGPAFERAYATLGAQRNLKILGIFARLWVQRGNTRYVDLMPRVWNNLLQDLAHPELATLREWVTHHLEAPGPLPGAMT
ncbi:MAG: phosphotransferase [Pseudomonadota bacterium]